MQGLLDAQANGLTRHRSEDDQVSEDTVSDGATTPTVSSLQERERGSESRTAGSRNRKKSLDANTARREIGRRILQLASVKAAENDFLEEDRRELQTILDKTLAWSQKRARLQGRIRDIEGDDSNERARKLREESAKLESQIRIKEEELRVLKARHRQVLEDMAYTENSHEAKIDSYKTSLSILDKEIVGFLKKPPKPRHVPTSSSPFLTLPPNRRTLDMAQDYWRDQITQVEEQWDDADRERAALDEGAVLWGEVVAKVTEFEHSVETQLQQTNNLNSDTYSLVKSMIAYLESRLEVATSRDWKLLICAISAELETLRLTKSELDKILGISRKGKEKKQDRSETGTPPKSGNKKDNTSPRRELSKSPPKSSAFSAPMFLDMHDEDPDPELMISR